MGNYRYSILILSLLFILSCIRLLADESVLVVGESYVARYPEGVVVQKIRPDSETFVEGDCSLLYRDGGTLHRFPNEELVKTGVLLTSTSDGRLLTLDDDHLTLRSECGTPSKQGSKLPFAAQIETAAFVGSDVVVVEANEKRVELHRFDLDLNSVSSQIIHEGSDTWPHFRLIRSESGKLSLGFSVTTTNASYVPFLHDGKSGHFWKEKGLFLDACARGESIFVARDIPTQPFTVPLQGLIEKVTEGKVDPVWSLEQNELPEAIACGQAALYFVQRNMLGSRSELWKLQDGRAAKLANLPDKVRKIYACK